MIRYVLDTSAILSFLFLEPGADRVLEIIETGPAVSPADETSTLLPFIALMEIDYWLMRRLPPTEARRVLLLVNHWPVTIVESSPDWRHEAARVKVSTALSLADSWIASLALLNGATLVHKDPEYDQLSSLLVERLPYRARES